MVIYFFILVVLCFSNLILHSTSRLNKYIFLTLIFGTCAIVLGLRGLNVGRDTYEYYSIFCNTSQREIGYFFNGQYDQKIEIGFALLIKVSSLLIDNYFFFQLMISCMFCALIAKFIYDNSENLYMSSIIFLGSGLFLQAFTVCRQYLAVAIIVNSWTYIKNKRYRMALFFLFLSFFIHKTSIVFIGAFLVWYFRKSKFFLWLIPFVSIIGIINYQRVFAFIAPYVSGYDIYLQNSAEKLSIGFSTLMWIAVGLVAVSLIFQKNTNYIVKAEAMMTLLYSELSFGGIYVNYLDRLAYYFLPFVMISLPQFSIYICERSRIKGLHQVFNIMVEMSYIAFYIICVLNATYLKYQFLWV